ncbi:MAG: DUF1353 domain-containing protein [Nitrospirales bacterium]
MRRPVSRRQFLLFTATLGISAPYAVGMFNRSHSARGSERDAVPSAKPGVAVETWMTKWMQGVSKAPGGMLKVSRFREPIYFLLAPISWEPNPRQTSHELVIAPTGFVTDLASIPAVFYSLLRPDGEYAYAAIIHDYLYWTQTQPREEADDIFNMAMEDFEVGSIKRNAIYAAVRAGGQFAWDNNAEAKAKGEKRILRRFPQDPRMRWEQWKQRDVFV